MKNKPILKRLGIWLYLYKGEVIKSLKMLVPIIIVIVIIRNLPSITRTYYLTRLDSETYGIMDSIEYIKGRQESEMGSRLVEKSYKVYYHYSVDDDKINQKEVIDRAAISLTQEVKLKKMAKGDTIDIKYNSKKALISKVILFAQ